MNCPSCGAPMRLQADKDYLVCDYCGTMHFPDPNADGVRVLDVVALESCPVCKVPLVHAAVNGERILYCNRCRGLLVEMEVFVAILDELRSRQPGTEFSVRQPDWNDLKRHINCPRCGAEMETHPYGGPGNVIIDSCEHCSMNWLDYSELQRIVRAPDRRYPTEETSAEG